jgi:hypothetical protein
MVKCAPIVSLEWHFHDLPLFKMRSSDNAVSLFGPIATLGDSEQVVIAVLDLITTVVEPINVPLHKVVS